MSPELEIDCLDGVIFIVLGFALGNGGFKIDAGGDLDCPFCFYTDERFFLVELSWNVTPNQAADLLSLLG